MKFSFPFSYTHDTSFLVACLSDNSVTNKHDFDSVFTFPQLSCTLYVESVHNTDYNALNLRNSSNFLFHVSMYIRGKKKNKIEEDLSRDSHQYLRRLLATSIVKLVVCEEYFSQLSNELYPSSKGTLSKFTLRRSIKKSREGERERERKRIVRKSLEFFKCKARALEIQTKPLHALPDRVEKFSFASRESGLHFPPRIHK